MPESLSPIEAQQVMATRLLALVGLFFYSAAAGLTILNSRSQSLPALLIGVPFCIASVLLSSTPRYRIAIFLQIGLAYAVVLYVIAVNDYPIYAIGVLCIPVFISGLFCRARTIVGMAAASLAIASVIVMNRQMQYTGPFVLTQLFVAAITLVLTVATRMARHTNQQLADSEAQFRSTFDNMPVPLWDEDFSQILHALDDLRRSGVQDMKAYLDTHPEEVDRLINLLIIRDVNPAAMRQFGISDKTGMLGSSFSISHPNNRPGYTAELLAIDERRLEFQLDGHHFMMHDEMHDLSLKWQVMKGHETDFSRVLISMMDVTEQRQAEVRRLDLLVERERVAMLQQFLGDVSHDILTPLTVFKSSLYLLGRAIDANDIEKARRRVVLLDSEVDRLEMLIRDMLTLSRLDQLEHTEFHFVTQDINETVTDMTRKFEPLAATRQQQLTLHPCAESLNIPFDRSNMERVLSNLIGNAIKYTPNGGNVRVSVEMQNDWAVIRVQDSGSGIPAKDLPHIFDRFFRADAHRPSTKGSGLGLSIAKRIVTAHGGRMEVESVVGMGSVFRVLLPRTMAEPSI